MKAIILAMSLCVAPASVAEQYWTLSTDGGIAWHPQPGQAHKDHVEMAGRRVATVLRYGVDENGEFSVEKSLVWPMLRTIPNNTHASLMRRFRWNPLDGVTVNGRALTGEQTRVVRLSHALETESDYDNGRYGKWRLLRTYFPSRTSPALLEQYAIINNGTKSLNVEIPEGGFETLTDESRGTEGAYRIVGRIHDSGAWSVAPGDTLRFSASISATPANQAKVGKLDETLELRERKSFRDSLNHVLKLTTPDSVLNRMMDFAKLRACESIFATKGGPMHGPGGESYYAAIWANDQAEYINPFFPFVGYDYGNESAMNSFRHFARFINDDYKPIPSSIIAEGDDIWNGAGDRGDGAMIAYGASRYALARGSAEEARELWPLIEWCLEYCRRQLNEEGVVKSDSDELEGRFPSGDANLCTSSLYYDALLSASYLARDLGYRPLSEKYSQEAKRMRSAINNYFAAEVEGYETYAYYKGNDVLRSWICIPLVMGIDEHAVGTVEALLSPRLMTENGLLTQAGDSTFWDRTTLYALRGALTAGETEKAVNFLKDYSRTRLLGEHVPYPVEAWPEGSQRHLSAESGLYCRVITEGLFGIRPTGLHEFVMTPRLPEEWPEMSLDHIRAFGTDLNVKVSRLSPGRLMVECKSGGRTHRREIAEGETMRLKLPLK